MFLIRGKDNNKQSPNLKTCANYVLKAKRNQDLLLLLNEGNELVFIDQEDYFIDDFLGLPRERLGLEIKTLKNFNFSQQIETFSNFILDFSLGEDGILELSKQFPKTKFYVSGADKPLIRKLLQKQIRVVVDEEECERDLEFFTEILMMNAISDRKDNLFPTVVVDEHGIGLGLCYSSLQSIQEAIKLKMGVYHSRKRVKHRLMKGLWRKGETSGATQELLKIDLDCDRDTLRFKVKQKNGFCHLETKTCFGPSTGLSFLFQTLESRLQDAPPNSYTKRLFQDKVLLNAKIKEEADEVCEAEGKEHLTEELADLIYFAFVKAVSGGVKLEDVEACLDKRALKVTRREGNAKPAYLPKNEDSITTVGEKIAISDNVELVPDFNLKVHNHSQLLQEEKQKLLLRPILDTTQIMDRVKPIMKQVREQGDKALIDLGLKFDKAVLDSVALHSPFSPKDMVISKQVKDSIDLAYDNILKFHQAQLEPKDLVVETMPGVTCTRFTRPIEKVGLYVPGGTAVLPSTALHLGIPAKVAGCQEIIIITPPKSDGTVAPEIVYVAEKIGAKMIVKAGGAQGVAAVAYGTETVPKVDKICGPGNQYVTCAKMIAQSDTSALVAIDMPAGPSELLVVCDAKADKSYVVSDLLSQAEHGPDSQVVLVTVGMDSTGIQNLQEELKRQTMLLPRKDIVKVSISKSYIIAMETIDEALAFSNKYAPEHLILNVDGAENLLPRIHNAGSVFLGAYSPESCGDYASGTNHTLPTYGYARMYSGVNTHTFLKHITSQKLSKEGLNAIGDAVTTLAAIEGLEAHRNAVAIRLKDLRK